MFLSVRALAICLINNTLGEYILMRKYFQGTSFCELSQKLQISWKTFREYKSEI